MNRVKLKEFMDRKGWTQQQLADAIDVKRELVAAWNTGRSDITRENLAKLFSVGMYFEEAFEDVELLRRNQLNIDNEKDSLSVVADGLQKILDIVGKSISPEKK